MPKQLLGETFGIAAEHNFAGCIPWRMHSIKTQGDTHTRTHYKQAFLRNVNSETYLRCRIIIPSIRLAISEPCHHTRHQHANNYNNNYLFNGQDNAGDTVPVKRSFTYTPALWLLYNIFN